MATSGAHTLAYPSPPLRYQEIQEASHAVLTALSRHDLEACFLGSTAGMFCGMEHRVPKDVDLLILNPLPENTAEAIKALVVAAGSDRFFLTQSMVPGATHQILWYSISEPVSGKNPSSGLRTARDSESSLETQMNNHPRDADGMRSRKKNKKARQDTYPSSRDMNLPLASESPVPSSSGKLPSRACKIDILIPGTLGIHVIPKALLQFHSDLTFHSISSKLDQPAAYPPLPLLLLLKLRAWQDHSSPDATERMHDHVPLDEEDIEELLRLGMNLGKDFSTTLPKRDSSNGGIIDHWTLAGFSSSKDVCSCVAGYVRKWPRTANGWFLAGYL